MAFFLRLLNTGQKSCFFKTTFQNRRFAITSDVRSKDIYMNKLENNLVLRNKTLLTSPKRNFVPARLNDEYQTKRKFYRNIFITLGFTAGAALLVYKYKGNDLSSRIRNLCCSISRSAELDQKIDIFEKEIDKSGLYNVNTAEACENIGKHYLEQQEIDKALEYFSLSSDIKRNVYNKKELNEFLPMTLYNMALCYIQLTDSKTAIKLSLKGLKMTRKVSKTSAMNGEFLYLLGICHFDQGEYKAALKYFKKSLKIMIKLDASMVNRDISNTLSFISLCHLKLKNFDKAIKHFEESVKIEKKLLENGNTEDIHVKRIVDILNAIANIYPNLNNNDKAIKVAAKVIEFADQNNCFEITNQCFNTMALCYFNQGNHLKGIETIEKKLGKSKDTGATYEDAKGYELIGLGYFQLGDFQKALKAYEKSLNIRENDIGRDTNNETVDNSLIGLGICHFKLGERDTAFDFLKKGLKSQIERGSYDITHPMSEALQYFAMCHMCENNYETALTYLKISLGIHIKLNEHKNKDYRRESELADLLGKCFCALKDYEMTLRIHVIGLHLRRKLYGINAENRDIATSYMYLASAFKALGDTQTALIFKDEFERLNKNC